MAQEAYGMIVHGNYYTEDLEHINKVFQEHAGTTDYRGYETSAPSLTLLSTEELTPEEVEDFLVISGYFLDSEEAEEAEEVEEDGQVTMLLPTGGIFSGTAHSSERIYHHLGEYAGWFSYEDGTLEREEITL